MGDQAICWIRRDLRLSDHAALSLATHAFSSVAVVFVFDSNILQALQDRSDRRVNFIYQSLVEVDQNLRALGSRLCVLVGNPVEEIPRIAKQLGAKKVFANRDYERYAIDRDQLVSAALESIGVGFESPQDHVVQEGRNLRTGDGKPFRVYTPFRKAWDANFHPDLIAEHRVETTNFACATVLDGVRAPTLPTLEEIGFEPSELILKPGRSGGLERLDWFASRIDDYGDDRDYPAKNGSSMISVHLRHGTISTREAFRFAHNNPSTGAEKWRQELIWREFYQGILMNFSHVVDGAFKPEYDALPWSNEVALFAAWCEGRTGYPIVDAAMRCLNATGWMHNRLRMVTASFLTKDLLIDWRWGEAYFAEKLLDFDLASNNGGWQWAASTGCDAQPYFRIFNPILQSKKFDADGDFIREWVPELAQVTSDKIHAPWECQPVDLFTAGAVLGTDYPEPIVDHYEQRKLATAMFASIATE